MKLPGSVQAYLLRAGKIARAPKMRHFCVRAAILASKSFSILPPSAFPSYWRHEQLKISHKFKWWRFFRYHYCALPPHGGRSVPIRMQPPIFLIQVLLEHRSSESSMEICIWWRIPKVFCLKRPLAFIVNLSHVRRKKDRVQCGKPWALSIHIRILFYTKGNKWIGLIESNWEQLPWIWK